MRGIILTLSVFGFMLFADAQVWQPLDGGLDNTPTAITSHNNLIATAQVTGYEKGYRVHKVSIWNGYYWLNLPPIYADSNSLILALKFYKGSLYIAGKVSEFKDVAGAKHIIRWKDRKYEKLSALSGNISNFNYINGLNDFDNQLLISGPFVTTSANYGESIALFNGVSLLAASNAAFGKGIRGNINDVFSNENMLVIGGRLTKANDTATVNLAYFYKNHWFRVSNNAFIPKHVVAVGSHVYFAGLDSKTKAKNFFKVNNGLIDTIDFGLTEVSEVYDMVVVNGVIYASGQFYMNGADNPVSLVKLDNGKWTAVENGNLLGLRLLLEHKEHLFASGFFTYHDGINYRHIARYLPNHGIISGKIYFDKDKNCLLNARDELLNEMNVLITPGPRYVKTFENGSYLAIMPKGSYTVTLLTTPKWEVTSCANKSLNVELEKQAVQTSLNFPVTQKAGIRDLAIKLSSSSGQSIDKNADISYHIQYENKGSENVANTRVVLHYDPKLGGLKAFPAPDEAVGDSAVWLITDLFAGEERMISCVFEINDKTGQILNLSADIALEDEEEITIDNHSELVQNLNEGDYDFKKEILGTIGDTAYINDSTDDIEYQVSFANYTSDTIFNVYVIDTIRLNHSLSIIQTTGASHYVVGEAFPGLPGEDLGIIVWSFPNINLLPNPDHNPEIVAHKGFVSFRLGLNSGISEGTVITNRANVVFDYYEEEATNWVYAIVNNQLASTSPLLELDQISIYPNPVNEELHIELEKPTEYSINVYSMNGQMMNVQSASFNSISTESYPPGMYVLQLQIEGELYTKRFIKL
ncbi:MAG: T9SS type A sorting domain-containing protein [Bacteroidia bacterium]